MTQAEVLIERDWNDWESGRFSIREIAGNTLYTHEWHGINKPSAVVTLVHAAIALHELQPGEVIWRHQNPRESNDDEH